MSLSGPSNAQIALAFILIKSRPIELSIEDHIHHIRAVIVRRRRKESPNSHHYIDGTLFWKQAFDQAEIEKSKLTARVFELEQALNRSKDILPPTPPLVKRKLEKIRTAKANTQSKRRKIDAHAVNDACQPVGLQLQTSVPGHRVLLQALCHIRLDTNKNDLPPSKLCQSVRVASHLAGQAIMSIYHERAGHLQSQALVLRDGLRFVAIIWDTLLRAARRIESSDVNARTTYISSMIQLFQRLLGQLQQYCLDEADRHLKHRRKRRPKASSNSVAADGTPIAQNRDFEMGCSALSESACQMLAALNLTSNIQCDVFEGLLCALLDHIGSSMSLLVFADPSVPIKKQEGVVAPRGLVDVAHIDSESAHITDQLAAPYLVRMLQKATGIVDELGLAQQRRLLLLDPSGPTEDVSLITRMKTKLQRTLLRGIYGDEDPIFKDGLRRFTELDRTETDRLMESYQKDLDKSEWFIGQVWEYIGWDILAAEL